VEQAMDGVGHTPFRAHLRLGQRLALALGVMLCAGSAVGTPLLAQDRDVLAGPAAAGSTLPAPLPPAPAGGNALRIWKAAHAERGTRILISLEHHRLWLLHDERVDFSAPVALGKPVVLEYDGHIWRFSTPRGRRVIEEKERDPEWIPPEWHYVELAVAQGWKLERLEAGTPVRLGNGDLLVVRGDRVGRVAPDGSFHPVPANEEVVVDDTLFVPPASTRNRHIRGQLGEYKLDLGDGYYIHGTPEEDSVGGSVSHGCIRMRADDLAALYAAVRVGTPVYLY
jgi:hypothetical protein